MASAIETVTTWEAQEAGNQQRQVSAMQGDGYTFLLFKTARMSEMTDGSLNVARGDENTMSYGQASPEAIQDVRDALESLQATYEDELEGSVPEVSEEVESNKDAVICAVADVLAPEEVGHKFRDAVIKYHIDNDYYFVELREGKFDHALTEDGEQVAVKKTSQNNRLTFGSPGTIGTTTEGLDELLDAVSDDDDE